MAVVESSPLIPGLPDEVAELCLLHVPYPYQLVLRAVSSWWKKSVSEPRHVLARKSVSLPHLFVLGVHRATSKMQWQSLDPQSGRWFLLPPMPCPADAYPPAFACASIPRQGKLFVLGGMRDTTPLDTTLVYSAPLNRWSLAAPMPRARSFFGAEYVGGKIVSVGGSRSVAAVDRYDPEKGAWEQGAEMRVVLARHETAVVGDRMLVTEGPCMLAPRGGVYEGDRWQDMSGGMREGWTGVSVALGHRLFVIAEDCQVKVYVEEEDTWKDVGGERFPRGVMERPLVATEVEGKIYVVSTGLHVAVGRVYEDRSEEYWRVTWQVIEAHDRFRHVYPVPSSCHVLYA